MTVRTALEVTAGDAQASPATGASTVTVERVYHEDRRSGAGWTHALGDDRCTVERCVVTGAFAGLRRYRPEG